MGISEKSRNLLLDVADAIEQHPERHDQSTWFREGESEVELNGTQYHCKTTQCVAGWICVLSRDDYLDDNHVWNTAMSMVPDVEDITSLFCSYIPLRTGSYYEKRTIRNRLIDDLRRIANGERVLDILHEANHDIGNLAEFDI